MVMLAMHASTTMRVASARLHRLRALLQAPLPDAPLLHESARLASQNQRVGTTFRTSAAKAAFLHASLLGETTAQAHHHGKNEGAPPRHDGECKMSCWLEWKRQKEVSSYNPQTILKYLE